MTPQNLKASPRKTLESIARKRGVAGSSSMRKDELVRAILKTVTAVQEGRKRSSGPRASSGSKQVVKGRATQISASRRTAPAAQSGLGRAVAGQPSLGGKGKRVLAQSATTGATKNLADKTPEGVAEQDLLAAMVLGPYWIRAHWSLSIQGVRRAEISLGSEWHRSVPMLRVFDVSTKDGASNIETELQQIPVHGGVKDWYIPVAGLPRSYRLQIGYMSPVGKFYSLARSNVVTPPLPGNPDDSHGHWMDIQENCEQVYAMSGGYAEQGSRSVLKDLFEQQLQRRMDHAPTYVDVTPSGQLRGGEEGVKLSLKAEVIVYGVTSQNAQVVFDGKPVKLDGLNSFRLRMPLNEGRHVLPIVATNPQTSAQQTAVLAIERNLKNLDLRTPEDL